MNSKINFKEIRPLVVLDTETTGFYYDAGDEIVELAAEKLVNFSVVATFHALVKPSRPLSPEVIAIHGIDNELLAREGQDPAHVFPQFLEFIAGSVLVGHNIRRFDYPFILSHIERLLLSEPENQLLDTLDLARQVLVLPNYKLTTVAAHFGIGTDGAHRAARDVEITREVLRRLLT